MSPGRWGARDAGRDPGGRRPVALRAWLAGALALATAAGVVASATRADGFPHAEHAGLFPTCLGCHRGIPEGDEARYYSVAPADCARCHDGEREERVTWEGPARTLSNLDFVHAEHASEVAQAGDSALACASCHGPLEAGQPRMAVDRAAPATCVGCHAHRAPDHLAVDVACGDCHRPLAEVPDLPTVRLAAFPEPPSHGATSFVFEHAAAGGAELESCAVCHARESCARCHLNAERVPAIGALPGDARIAELVAHKPAAWPEPESHAAADWFLAHGDAAVAGSQACANCHAEPSCRSCHGAAAIAEIATLPTPMAGEPAGVVVPWRRPPGHGAGFATQHGAAVAADLPRCASCHVEDQCAECHAAAGRTAAATSAGALRSETAPRTPAPSSPAGTPTPTSPADAAPGASAAEAALYRHAEAPPATLPPEPRPGYHPENFLVRHGAEAFAVQSVCSDCHSTEVFCRDCHRAIGSTIGAGGGAGGAFHDAQPNWFFEHGRAARQGLEACASCHQQTSCLRCHSAKSGLRINPHGPGFDPDRVAARSTMSCGICHSSDQIPPP